MPSKESAVLRDMYERMAARRAGTPQMDLDTFRDMAEGLRLCGAEPTGVTYDETTAAGLPAIWATPVGCDTDRVILYLHGGGFVLGTKDRCRKIAAHLAKAAGCSALIPDYRLAPEHVFPAQLEDTLAIFEWLVELGYSPSNVAFVGDSAGGNLATVASLALKRDNQPLPAAIVAFSPWYDLEVNGETLESNAGKDVFASREAIENMVAMYLGEHSPTDPLANPLHADLTGMPAIFLTCGGHEALRDNAERFAALAERAGVDVRLEVAQGMLHVYQYLAGRAPEADATIAAAGKWLRTKLGA